MEILLSNISSIESDNFTAPHIMVTADLALPSQVIYDIEHEMGAAWVLNAIGEKKIQRYMELNGYMVVDINKADSAA